MAIEKTIFTQTTAATNIEEVYTYLAANATDYFDEITSVTDDSGQMTEIDCMIDGRKALYFSYGTSSYINLYSALINGANVILCVNANSGNFAPGYFDYAKKTSNGIMLAYVTNGSNYNGGTNVRELVITKADTGNTMLVNWGGYKYYLSVVDTMTSTALMQRQMNCDSSFTLTSYTALTPIVAPYGSYTPHLFYAGLYSQYTLIDNGDVTMGGTDYATRGALWLES